MNVLAEVALVAIFLLLLGGLAFRRSRAISPASFSWTELLDEAISGVSTAGERLDEMREIFDPLAYVEVSPDGSSWSPTIREGLRERARSGRSHIALVEKNIGSFERLGLHATIYTLGEDELAREITRKATDCKLLLRSVKRRVRIHDAMPLFMWRIMSRKMAHNCVYGGTQLILEYEELANAVLAFVRTRGEDYQYEPLLSAYKF